jgi:undecaprenyl diphosphate synthase
MIEHAVVTPAIRAVPRHVAIIMDGVRCWASERDLPFVEGCRAGAVALRDVVREAEHLGVEMITACVSDDAEGQALAEYIRVFSSAGCDPREGNIRIRAIGQTDRLPAAPRTALFELIERTQACTGFLLTLATEYEARAEIRDAVRALARDIVGGTLKAVDVDEKTLAGYLSTADLPDPDLLIRAGGNLRLSNFLLFQAAYSELWATDAPWPDFRPVLLRKAAADFAKRQRRFGR